MIGLIGFRALLSSYGQTCFLLVYSVGRHAVNSTRSAPPPNKQPSDKKLLMEGIPGCRGHPLEEPERERQRERERERQGERERERINKAR